jgi:hypothetical protein
MTNYLDKIKMSNAVSPETINLIIGKLNKSNDLTLNTSVISYTVASEEVPATERSNYDFTCVDDCLVHLDTLLEKTSTSINIRLAGGTHRIYGPEEPNYITDDLIASYVHTNMMLFFSRISAPDSASDEDAENAYLLNDANIFIDKSINIPEWNVVFGGTATMYNFDEGVNFYTNFDKRVGIFGLLGSLLVFNGTAEQDNTDNRSEKGVFVFGGRGTTMVVHDAEILDYYVGMYSGKNCSGYIKNTKITGLYAGYVYLLGTIELDDVDDTSEKGFVGTPGINIRTGAGCVIDRKRGVITEESMYGPTSERPEYGEIPAPACYFDTDLGYAISWDGKDYVNADGDVV